MQTESESAEREVDLLGRFKPIVTYASLFLMLGLTASTLLEVLIRYTTWLPTHWGGGELPIVFLIWSIGLGVICATVTESHLKLDIFDFPDSARWRWLHGFLVEIVCLAMALIFAYYTLTYSISNIGSRTPSLGISYFFISISLFLGLAASSVFYLFKVAGRLASFCRKKGE